MHMKTLEVTHCLVRLTKRDCSIDEFKTSVEMNVFGLVYRTALVLDLSNTFIYLFAFIFECAPNAASFLFVTVSPYHQRFTPNHDSMNRLLWVHGRRFSAGTVVFEHSPGKHVSSEDWKIRTRKRIVVSLHHFSALVSINEGIKRNVYQIMLNVRKASAATVRVQLTHGSQPRLGPNGFMYLVTRGFFDDQK